MAESAAVRTLRDLVWTIQDAGAAHTYAPTVVQGDFAYSAPLYDLVRIRDAGDLYHVRKGDSQPVTLSFSAILTDIGKTATEATLPDICEERGWANSNWVNTSANETDVKTYNLILTYDGTFAGEADRTLTFPDMVFRGSFTGGYPNTYAVTAESATAYQPTLA
jgi:hypothetical protein